MSDAPSKSLLRRAHRRLSLRGEAMLAVPGQAPRAVRTWDLGQEGMSLMSPKPIAPGVRCMVVFDVPVADARKAVSAAAKVLYSSFTGRDGFRLGLAFTHLDDESASTIRDFAATTA